MTKEQIENLPSGREIEALIAVEIFEWRWMAGKISDAKLTACLPPNDLYPVSSDAFETSDDKAERYSDWDRIGWEDKTEELHIGFPHYSTDIRAAWEIIEEIAEAENHHWRLGSIENAVWFAAIRDKSKEKNLIVEASAGTVPLAICRVALLWKFNKESK